VLTNFFIAAMNSTEMHAVVDKIRASGCLSEGELQRQVTMVNGCATLMRIDRLDRWWEVEVEKYVCRAAKLGKRHMPSLSNAAAVFAFGILSGGYGVFLISEMSKGIHDYPEVRWLAGGLLAVGCLLFFQAGRSFVKMRRYKPVLQNYQASRRGELEKLAAAHRPGWRICLKCLKYTV
jgi:hypothetical protein